MIKHILFVLFFCSLLSSCMEAPKEYVNANGLITELVVNKSPQDNYNFVLRIMNSNSYDVGIVYIGRVINKNFNNELGSLFADTIIKVQAENFVVFSSQINKGVYPLDTRTPELVIIKSGQTQELTIPYNNNIRDIFGVDNREVFIQLILKPSARYLSSILEMTENEFSQKYPEARLIKDEVLSPLVKLR